MNQSGRIVVGYDGSEHSEAALTWAATEAQRRGWPLTVLHVVDYLGWIPSPTGPFGWSDVDEDEIARIAKIGAERAAKIADVTEIVPVTKVASAAAALVEFSSPADLLVVGTRGHGDLAGTVLGSVAFAVSAHAPCPTVVVRGDSGPPGPARVVIVGVDGSTGSDEALRYAGDLAAAAAAPLIIASSYRSVASQAWAEAYYSSLESGGGPDFDTVARKSAETAVTTAAQVVRQAYPGLEIREQVQEGPPARVIAAVAAGSETIDGVAGSAAGLVVVGSRGHGGFAGLMLGSVGHALIHSSPCPVVIVRAGQPSQETSAENGDG